MAVVVAAMVNGAPKLYYSYTTNHQLSLKPTKKKQMGSPKFIFNTQTQSSTKTLKIKSPSSSSSSSPPVNASNSPPEEGETPPSTIINDTKPLSQEDWNYLWKLGAGSVAGAAVIKYGSIVFPDITKPNILQALVMVLIPIFLAIFLLIKQSRGLK